MHTLTVGMQWHNKKSSAPEGESRACSRGVLTLFLGACLLALLAPARGRAEEAPADSPTSPQEQAAPPEAEESGVVRILVNGYLSQAFAISDGNQIAGIPKQGTADYRTAAVQMRAEITPQDKFSVKLRHERVGQSGLQALQPDVAFDWIFYEHQMGATAIKVGRVKIPFGIYNEVRDVGTLLPFYRPSPNFYGEGAFTTETVDGAVVSHVFDVGSWRLDGDLHYGNWRFIDRVGNTFRRRDVRNSRGAELWVKTPISSLRVGAGAIHYDVLDLGNPGHASHWKTHHFSLDGEFGRVMAQVEYKYIDFAEGTYVAGYAHLGVKVADKVTLNAQYDYADLNIDFFRSGRFDTDRVLGVSYAFRLDLVLKMEHHWNEGFTSEEPAQNFFAPAVRSRFAILSLSTSF